MLLSKRRLKFLYLAVLFEKLIEQHRVHRVVAKGVNLALLIAHYQILTHVRRIFGDQAKLPSACWGVLVLERNRLKCKNSFTVSTEQNLK
jgi:hypothetical protein